MRLKLAKLKRNYALKSKNIFIFSLYVNNKAFNVVINNYAKMKVSKFSISFGRFFELFKLAFNRFKTLIAIIVCLALLGQFDNKEESENNESHILEAILKAQGPFLQYFYCIQTYNCF